MADVSATWTSPTGSQCVATGSGGHSVVMDAPNGRAEWAGFKPSELLLAALLGCTGVDFTSILAKQRQVVTAISAEAHGEQDQDPPWAYRRIDVVFTVHGPNLDERAVDRALTLAFERYCSVGATLVGVATITHRAVVVAPAAAARCRKQESPSAPVASWAPSRALAESPAARRAHYGAVCESRKRRLPPHSINSLSAHVYLARNGARRA
jgi:putative redox protein